MSGVNSLSISSQRLIVTTFSPISLEISSTLMPLSFSILRTCTAFSRVEAVLPLLAWKGVASSDTSFSGTPEVITMTCLIRAPRCSLAYMMAVRRQWPSETYIFLSARFQ